MRPLSVSLLLLMLLVPAKVRAGEETEALFGLVIGCNITGDPDVAALRYADDDAVQNAGLLAMLGAQVVLLANLDAESKALYPKVLATAPTKASVKAAMDELNRMMKQSRHAGRLPVLYIFYSGHGDVENNQGYVVLEDGKLWRSDFIQLLEGSQAHVNHVVVDACKSYFLVFDRGAGGVRRPVSVDLLADENQLPENAGMLLSTSSAADSHEWEAFQGGIFSHEVRSALRGGADVNGDGAVTYEEIAAFVWTANRAIISSRFRPTFLTHPPARQDASSAVIMDLKAGRGDRLAVGPGVGRRLYVEDDRGLRLADLHPGTDQKVVVFLPSRRPMFVRWPESGEEVEVPSGSQLVLADLSPRKITVRRRGAEHVAFRSLFARPFDRDALVAYRNRPPSIERPASEKTDLSWVRRWLGIAAVTVGGAGATLTALAYSERGSISETTTGIERIKVNRRIDDYNTAAVTCYAIAGAALAAYLVWKLWPEEEVQIQVLPSDAPQVQLSVRFW